MSSDSMTYEKLLGSITPEIYQNLRTAVELGKWPDGRKLTPEQREQCLQAVIAWEQKNVPEEQRTGYLEQSCSSSKDASELDTIQPLNLTRH
ncbi:YeaC family protein [Aestuariirhabdus sp. Z084]|uniref:YeaC family protein n=1 Tax=Aestuariirhabdus haliotis TaxID=2918751 RepID=UPI00201B3D31|nr:DUF1315 family protein [Aestuariirhabdus haliotis]MCL6414724.1 YeaC family protein [Aestuariirhabdus haliotis]MCL6418656.1 YeaC family protein [Aestuariirhabdus haliotis]